MDVTKKKSDVGGAFLFFVGIETTKQTKEKIFVCKINNSLVFFYFSGKKWDSTLSVATTT
jgi:hypothetical protein